MGETHLVAAGRPGGSYERMFICSSLSVKNFLKNFQKVLDKCFYIWYNISVKGRGEEW